MATASPIPMASGVVFRDVTWVNYKAQLRIVGDRPIRVTYDQGTMEVSCHRSATRMTLTDWAGWSTP